jgi:hypothetical protein
VGLVDVTDVLGLKQEAAPAATPAKPVKASKPRVRIFPSEGAA